jgi:hypothetical protein
MLISLRRSTIWLSKVGAGNEQHEAGGGHQVADSKRDVAADSRVDRRLDEGDQAQVAFLVVLRELPLQPQSDGVDLGLSLREPGARPQAPDPIEQYRPAAVEPGVVRVGKGHPIHHRGHPHLGLAPDLGAVEVPRGHPHYGERLVVENDRTADDPPVGAEPALP